MAVGTTEKLYLNSLIFWNNKRKSNCENKFLKIPKTRFEISLIKLLFQIFPEDLWITRPIHIRDREVVCNDLLSVDCGIDSIYVSISHDMLKTVGEQYPINRLGMCEIAKANVWVKPSYGSPVKGNFV